MLYLLSVLALAAGIAAGLPLPDLDQHLPFLLHRSILTHGFLLPLLLFVLARRSKVSWPRLFVCGLSGAVAVHLGFDLFPQGWTGFALISLPFAGRTSPVFSWLWIALSIVVCLGILLALLRRAWEAAVGLAGLAVTFAVYAVTQHVAIWPELLALVAAMAITLAWRFWYGRLRGRPRRIGRI
jgi:hypothetical protein